MGCPLGKLKIGGCSEEEEKEEEEEEVTPVAPALDPRLPLTARQKFHLLASWRGISREMESTGVHMFLVLFESDTEIINLFSKFKEFETREELANSQILMEHAKRVMDVLDEGIKALDDMEVFFKYVHRIGALHRKIPEFHVEYFWKIEEPFLSAVQTTLGERYSQNVDIIYKIIIRFIIETLVNGYDKNDATTTTATTTISIITGI